MNASSNTAPPFDREALIAATEGIAADITRMMGKPLRQARNEVAGMTLDGQRARMDKVQSIRMTRVRVVLRQGINRQIRRMFYELGYEVKKLVRVRVGHLRLGDLPRGHWRPLSKSELKSLAQARRG